MSQHSGSDDGSNDGRSCDCDFHLRDWQLEALARFPKLPQEIQDLTLSYCDIQQLSVLNQLNREWNARITPRLWHDLDFVAAYDDGPRFEATRRFFVACEKMLDEQPDRFATLASYVHRVDVGRLVGINIVPNYSTEFDFFDDHNDHEKRCVFDIFAQFRNLESLSVYIKNWWGYGSQREATGQSLIENLPKLRSVKVGGQMPNKILNGLITPGERVRDLTLINLIESPGQDSGPEPICWLTEEHCKSLSNLETLYLCKLADLASDAEFERFLEQSDSEEEVEDWEDTDSYGHRARVSGMRWEFPREGEAGVFEEWAKLLRHTSKTLRSVTLENRYLCSYRWNDYEGHFIDPGDTHPAGLGANSTRQSQSVLFPLFFTLEWPALQELALAGMGTEQEVMEATGGLREQGATVERRAARFVLMGGDATPEEISTPVEFADAWVKGEKSPYESENDGSDGEKSDGDD